MVVACATATSDPTLRRQAANVRLISAEEKQQGVQPYTVIREVIGASCGRQLGSDPSVDSAREMLRIEAAKLGADAV